MNKLDLGKKVFIHELTEFSSLAEYYQIMNQDKSEIASAAEDASFGAKIAKMFFDKSLIPVSVNIKNAENQLIVRIEQSFSFPQHNFTIKNHDGKCISILNQKLSLLGSNFSLYDSYMNPIGSITGDVRNKQFNIKRLDGAMIATINHRSSNLARDLFTTADDYEIDINDCSYDESLIALASAICMDFVFHES